MDGREIERKKKRSFRSAGEERREGKRKRNQIGEQKEDDGIFSLPLIV